MDEHNTFSSPALNVSTQDESHILLDIITICVRLIFGWMHFTHLAIVAGLGFVCAICARAFDSNCLSNFSGLQLLAAYEIYSDEDRSSTDDCFPSHSNLCASNSNWFRQSSKQSKLYIVLISYAHQCHCTNQSHFNFNGRFDAVTSPHDHTEHARVLTIGSVRTHRQKWAINS